MGPVMSSLQLPSGSNPLGLSKSLLGMESALRSLGFGSEVLDDLLKAQLPKNGTELLHPHLKWMIDNADEKIFDSIIRLALANQIATWRKLATINVLALGCGNLREGFAVHSGIGEVSYGQLSPRIQVWAVDIDWFTLASAEQRYTYCRLDADGSLKTRPVPGFHFHHGNGTQLEGVEDLPEKFELAYLRDQNASSSESDWGKMFACAMERLSETGRMLITSRYADEHNLAIKKIMATGRNIEYNKFNEKSRIVRPGKEYADLAEHRMDGWIAVVG